MRVGFRYEDKLDWFFDYEFMMSNYDICLKSFICYYSSSYVNSDFNLTRIRYIFLFNINEAVTNAQIKVKTILRNN